MCQAEVSITECFQQGRTYAEIYLSMRWDELRLDEMDGAAEKRIPCDSLFYPATCTVVLLCRDKPGGQRERGNFAHPLPKSLCA